MEFVWVVPREKLLADGPWEGLHCPASAEFEERFLAPARAEGFFMERRYAEHHPAYKQLIPYVVVHQGTRLLCLQRLATQGEERLHGKRSIGVGGHINPRDEPPGGPGPGLVQRACMRELHEELVLPEGPLPLTPLGLLNDDATEVGSVHLGLVYLLDASGFQPRVRETDAMEGTFEELTDLQASLAAGTPPAFEGWTAHLLQSEALASACASLSPSTATPSAST